MWTAQKIGKKEIVAETNIHEHAAIIYRLIYDINHRLMNVQEQKLGRKVK